MKSKDNVILQGIREQFDWIDRDPATATTGNSLAKCLELDYTAAFLRNPEEPPVGELEHEILERLGAPGAYAELSEWQKWSDDQVAFALKVVEKLLAVI